jgi:hypothetical protein
MRAVMVASVLAALCSTPAAFAAGERSLDDERAGLEAQIARELGAAAVAQPAGPGSPAAAGAGQDGAGTKGGAGALARVLLLPDISAIGSFAAVHDSYDAGALSPRSGSTGPAGKPTFLFQELELAFQAVVDPYARADVFVSFTPQEVSVEEASLTTLALPAGLQARAGRLFSPFGRLNTTHPHTWEFLDAPLAHDRLVGNEKLGGPGVDLSWLAPLPWFAELHLAAQSTAPFPGEAERLTGVARLAQFFALSEAATLGLGLSGARRDEGPGAFRDLAGLDLFLKVRPISGRASLALQAELFARRFRALASPPDGGNGWGAYAQLFWRQDPWLGYGVRWDRAPAAGDGTASGAEQRWSVVGDWFASEFQRLGLQASWDQRPAGRSGWEWLLHLEFVIGAHGAHPF